MDNEHKAGHFPVSGFLNDFKRIFKRQILNRFLKNNFFLYKEFIL